MEIKQFKPAKWGIEYKKEVKYVFYKFFINYMLI